MPHARYTNDEIVRLGQELYEREIRARVEPEHDGQFLVLDIETGEYEIGATAIEAIRRAKAKRDDPPLYILRIGQAAAYKLGARFLAEES